MLKDKKNIYKKPIFYLRKNFLYAQNKSLFFLSNDKKIQKEIRYYTFILFVSFYFTTSFKNFQTFSIELIDIFSLGECAL